jgi:hypothetical protein
MINRAGFVLAAVLLAASVVGCDPDARNDEAPAGEAEQALCNGYVINNLATQAGSFHLDAPQYLLDSTEAWGPQTLLLSVDRHVTPQITVAAAPGVQIQKDKLTRTLQTTVGFSLSHELELTASSSTVVDEGTYARLEAYPSYQVLTWDLWLDACGPFGGARLGSGAVYRPMGVYFKVVVLASSSRRPVGAPATQPGPGLSSPIIRGEVAHD